MRSDFRSRWLVLLLLVGLPLALLHRALFCGDAFVPADLLAYVAPWSHSPAADHPIAAWNVLRYDGITQFYPWRLLAARLIQSGHVPLWNPYAFAAAGGAPLLADSQSAPLYPPNVVFFDLFPPRLFWYAFGLSAFAHLTIAGWGVYRFTRALGLRRAAALLGAVTFALSSPVVTWLSLPTFLAVACWIPWLLLSLRALFVGNGMEKRRAPLGVAVFVGLMLLAGHLQIAVYGLLVAVLYALTLIFAHRKEGKTPTRRLIGVAGAALVGILLALPQLLPSVELSRVSARAGNDQPYDGYIATALPLRNLVTLMEPDFFGHPNPVDTPYWNTPRSNYAEWALYTGIAPLFLAGFALGLPWRRRKKEKEEASAASPPVDLVPVVPADLAHAIPTERAFFAVTGLCSLLIALGTSLAKLLFYGIPGFRATGSPARILIVFALSVAVLAAIGLENLLRGDLPRAVKERAALVGIAGPLLLAAFGASQVAQYQATFLPGTTLAGLLDPVRTSLLSGIGLMIVSATVVVVATRLTPTARNARILAGLLIALTTSDLILHDYGYNPTVPHDQVYPTTPGIAYLLAHAKPNDMIAPIQRNWSMVKEDPPHGAVLPPNALTVYGLHDIAGYDSLFPGTAKNQLRDAANSTASSPSEANDRDKDPSPTANGNMLFVKRPETALALGARFLVFAPDAPVASQPPPNPLRLAYAGDDLTIWENPMPRAFGETVGAAYRPASFRVGLFAALVGMLLLIAWGWVVARKS